MTRALFLCSCPGQGSWLPHTCLTCQSVCLSPSLSPSHLPVPPPPSHLSAPLPISLTPACPLSLPPSHQFYLHASWEPPGFCLYPVSLPCLSPRSLSAPLSATFRIPCDSTVPVAHFYLGALCNPPPGSLFLSLGLCPSFLSPSVLTPLHVSSFQPTPHFQKTGVLHPRLYTASSGCPRASQPPPSVSGFLCCLLFSFPLREPQDLAQPSPDFLVPTHIEQWVEEASQITAE